jgi:16S rRNA (adenine1518-N6/adenine1519-N6)-dimethyltransferase
MSGPRPKKRFSQNFLADKNIAAKIVSYLDLNSSDVVFEIGSGRGTLTQIIGQSGARLFSFEIDNNLIEPLLKKFNNNSNIKIINADFLKIDPSDYHGGEFKLIGNIPYDITSPLIDWMTRYRHKFTIAIITVQKELAERLCSNSGTKDWAPVSIFTQCFFDIKKLMTIPPQAFYPPPKIYSTVLSFTPKDKYKIDNWPLFEKIVRQAFKHRRKLLINNLSEIEQLDKKQLENILTKLGLNNNIRAEQLSIEDYIRLTKEIAPLK